MGKVKNVPKLRFAEFKDTIPFRTLENHIELMSGFAFKGEDISEDQNGIPILRGINITEGYIRHSPDIDRFFVGTPDSFERFLLKKGDLVLGMDGSKVGKNVAIISEHDDGAILIQRVARIRAKKTANINYIYQHVFSNRFHRYVDVVNTSSGIPHISSKQIKEFKIPFPTLPEQEKIANFLTAVDAKISNLSEEKNLLEQYKKGAMQQIFSQELRFKIENEDGELVEPPEWENKRLGEVFIIGSGRDYKHLSEGSIPVYGTGGLMTKVDQFLFEGESVCIGRKGTIDKPMFLHGKFWTVDTLFYTHSFNNSIPKFIYYSFLNINWIKHNEASGVPSLSKRTIETIAINLPSLKEQTKIANFLSAIDEKIATVSEALEGAQAFKKGLLQQLFV